jgi:hypothetical protein
MKTSKGWLSVVGSLSVFLGVGYSQLDAGLKDTGLKPDSQRDLKNADPRADPRVEPDVKRVPGMEKDRVVAYLALPGSQERYVITAGAQLIRIAGSGESSVVGVVTAPGETPFLCLIRTARLVLGVLPDGRLLDIASGLILGHVIAVGSDPSDESRSGGSDSGCPGMCPEMSPGQKPTGKGGESPRYF